MSSIEALWNVWMGDALGLAQPVWRNCNRVWKHFSVNVHPSTPCSVSLAAKGWLGLTSTGMQLSDWCGPGWLLISKWNPAQRGLCFAVLRAVERSFQRLQMPKAVGVWAWRVHCGVTCGRRCSFGPRAPSGGAVNALQGSCAGTRGGIFLFSHLCTSAWIVMFIPTIQNQIFIVLLHHVLFCPYWIVVSDSAQWPGNESEMQIPTVWCDLGWLNKMVAWLKLEF